MKNLPEDLSAYPGIRSITQLIGEEKAAQISWLLGGKTLYIPRNPGPDSPLSVAVGVEDARTLSEIYGGMEMVVPISLGKRIEMRRMIREGKSVNEIVRHLRCARGTVYRCRKEVFNENQLDLFDPPPLCLKAH